MQQSTEIKHVKISTSIDLKKQQFQSSKERPELDPVLSALIGEDVKKSIDAKRNSEIEHVSTAANLVLTTPKSIYHNAGDTDVIDSIAGSSSEKKQVIIFIGTIYISKFPISTTSMFMFMLFMFI